MRAQPRGEPVGRKFPLVTLGRADGLPSGQIHGLASAKGGQLWCATPNGLAHHDGLRTTVLTRDDGLSTHGLRCVALTPDGDVWVGGDVGVDRVTAGGEVEPLVDGWSWGLVEDLTTTNQGSVLAASAKGLVIRHENTGWTLVDDDRLHSMVRRIAVDDRASGYWWAASPSAGLLRRTPDGAWAEPDENDWRAVGLITSVAVQPDGTLIVAGNNGIAHVDQQGRTVRPIDGVSGEVSAAWAGDGELWLGTRGRLLVMASRRGRWVPDEEVLTDVRVNRITRDPDGTIWVATDGAGAVLIEGIRDVISRPDIPGIGAVYAVRRSMSGDLLLGGDQASVRLTTDREPTVIPLVGLEGHRCWDVIDDDDGLLWAATDSGLMRVEAGERRAIGADHDVLSAPGRTLLRRGASLWVGTLSGLAIVEGNGRDPKVRTVDDNGTPLGYVYTLEQGVDAAWVGTLGNGLWLVIDGTARRVLGDGLIATGNTYAIACRPDGSAVVLQDDRIVVVDADDEATILTTTTDALAGWTLVLGRDDDVYVGGSSGLRRYDLLTGAELLHCTLWMGLVGWEFTTSRSLFRDEHDRLLCGLSSGFAAVHLPGLRGLAVNRPDVAVSDIVWSNATPTLQAGVHEVTEGKWSVDISVHAVWALRESSLQFRHRLLGFGDAWSVPDDSGRVRFSSLPPGWYSVQVQVHSPLAGWGSVREVATIRVRSRGWGQRLRDGRLTRPGRLVHRLAQENHALEQRVRERTVELERAGDELSRVNQDLVALSFTDALTGLANRRRFDDSLHGLLEVARVTGRPLALLLIDVDEFKAYNDSEGHLAGDGCLRTLGDIMREVVRRESDLVARYGGEEFAALLPDTGVDEATRVAERLRQELEGLAIEHRASSAGDVVTVSVGVAAVTLGAADDEPDPHLRLIHRADRALYAAKSAGRNCVVAAPDD